ncbi:MAG TPA: hypothetical protein VM261_31345 [Kofleriaceae bacterium]|nr:hypothetical protein [Kofleriaceae bacterium]
MRHMWWVVAVAACGCGANGDDDPRSAAAAELYGLRAGASWVYLRADGQVRWKEITACEDTPVLDRDQNLTIRRTYVRENRDYAGLTSVHYLAENDLGDVIRVRRDDIDGDRFDTMAMYDPHNTRLFASTARGESGGSQAFAALEFQPSRDFHGVTTVAVLDTVLGVEPVTVGAGTFSALHVQRGLGESWYAPDVGELVELHPLEPWLEEHLIAFHAGDGACDATSDVCANGACGASECSLACGGSERCCIDTWGGGGETCTSLARDPLNCGACGRSCDAGRICDRGQCACPSGSGDCAVTGVCAPLLSDKANCGACGNACGDDAPFCVAGVCLRTCETFDLTDCGGRCVDVRFADADCGACGRVCGAGTTGCVGGECQTCEQAGLADCGGECRDLDWSESNCGVCGRPCSTGQACVRGVCMDGDSQCAMSCGDGELCCGGACFDPRTSDLHCGGCAGATCAPTCNEACRDGACVPADCGDDGEGD